MEDVGHVWKGDAPLGGLKLGLFFLLVARFVFLRLKIKNNKQQQTGFFAPGLAAAPAASFFAAAAAAAAGPRAAGAARAAAAGTGMNTMEQ